MKKVSVALIVMALGFGSDALCKPRTAEVARAGMKCFQNSLGDIQCDYHVGKAFFTITGVGEPDVTTTFMHSDFDEDYYLSWGASANCVVVMPNTSNILDFLGNMAWVSPRTGKVYENWTECSERGR